MVDWYYIFSILWWGVYPSPQSIYNVGANTNYVPGSWQSYLLLHQRPAPHAHKELLRGNPCLPAGRLSPRPELGPKAQTNARTEGKPQHLGREVVGWILF